MHWAQTAVLHAEWSGYPAPSYDWHTLQSHLLDLGIVTIIVSRVCMALALHTSSQTNRFLLLLPWSVMTVIEHLPAYAITVASLGICSTKSHDRILHGARTSLSVNPFPYHDKHFPYWTFTSNGLLLRMCCYRHWVFDALMGDCYQVVCYWYLLRAFLPTIVLLSWANLSWIHVVGFALMMLDRKDSSLLLSYSPCWYVGPEEPIFTAQDTWTWEQLQQV